MATFRIVLSITMIRRLRQSVARVNHRRAWIRSSMACCSAAVIVPDDIVCCSSSLCAARTLHWPRFLIRNRFVSNLDSQRGCHHSSGDDIRHTGRAIRRRRRTRCDSSAPWMARSVRTSDVRPEGSRPWAGSRGRAMASRAAGRRGAGCAFFRPPEGFAAFFAFAPLAFTERRLGARRPPARGLDAGLERLHQVDDLPVVSLGLHGHRLALGLGGDQVAELLGVGVVVLREIPVGGQGVDDLTGQAQLLGRRLGSAPGQRRPSTPARFGPRSAWSTWPAHPGAGAPRAGGRCGTR